MTLILHVKCNNIEIATVDSCLKYPEYCLRYTLYSIHYTIVPNHVDGGAA